ncbi:MAG TPA: rhodanese-like domain-containing protein [Candidatus Xenobia bacterium]|nr:rhodanese-like domain-containing protein [Candidatus Xenobia bacterium]
MEIKRIAPEEAKQLLDSGDYVYLDVRSTPEFAAGHVLGAKNVPLLEPDASGRMAPNPRFLEVVEKNFARDAKLITGCQKGGRSMKAAELLVQAGFTNVVDMRGGFGAETDQMGRVTFPGWTMRGLPATQEAPPEDRYEALAKK